MKNAVNTLSVTVILFILSNLVWSSSLTSNAPINVDRLTVVIIEETQDRSRIPPEQLNAINSQRWREYVNKNNGQWRVLDPDTDVHKDEQWVQDAVSLERESIPWLIVSKQRSGSSTPLPLDIDGLMEKIKK